MSKLFLFIILSSLVIYSQTLPNNLIKQSDKFTISGYLTYDNSYNSPISNTTIHLTQDGNIVASTTTNYYGHYSFDIIDNGTYTLIPVINKPAYRMNSANLLAIQMCAIGAAQIGQGLKFKAGDIDNSGKIDAYDVYLALGKTQSLISQFPKGDWFSETPSVIIDGNSAAKNIKAICYGDVLGTYIPPRTKDEDYQSIAKTVSKTAATTTPKEFALLQNYPNPFNPETTIKYSVPEQSRVEIGIYNIIGQKVAELFNGIKEAGTYEMKFKASGLTSGTYIYSLKAVSVNGKAAFNASKKLIYLK